MDSSFDWSEVAEGWDTYRDFVERVKHEVTADLLNELRLQPGEHVLELGAGTGELALRLADAVGPTGRVHATDVAAGMVELITRTAADRPEITTAVVDAAKTDLPPATYDAVVFRMGLMLVPEPENALAECGRVLRDGGRLGVTVWSAAEHNPWLIALGMAAMMHGVGPAEPPTAPGGVFSLGSPDVLEKLVADAGFADVRVREVATTSRYTSPDDHFEKASALAGPLGKAIAAAPAEKVAAVRATAAELLAPYRIDDGYAVPGQALLATARIARSETTT